MTPDQVFDLAYAFDRQAEGGFYDDPNAGPTMDGILQSTYDHWRDSKCLPRQDVRNITDDEVKAINRDEFWDEPKLSLIAQVAPATAAAIYDFGENIGYGRKPGRDNPIQILQRRTGARVIDGILGSQSIDALSATLENVGGDLAFTKIYNKDRLAWYEIHSPQGDKKGLDNRVNDLNEYLQEHFA